MRSYYIKMYVRMQFFYCSHASDYPSACHWYNITLYSTNRMQVFPFIYKMERIAYIQMHIHMMFEKKWNKCNFSSISNPSRQDVTFIKRLTVKWLLYLYFYTFNAHITWNKLCFISQRSLSLCISIVKTVQTSIHIFSLWTHWQLCMNVHSTTGKTGSPTQWTGSPHPPTVDLVKCLLWK